jgi:hypothetical protein
VTVFTAAAFSISRYGRYVGYLEFSPTAIRNMKALARLALLASLAIVAPSSLAQHADLDNDTDEQPAAAERTDQVIYKGVVGNLLDAVPMDPEERVKLQRGHAVVSAPFSARSIALLLGVANPAVMIGGLIWGIWAAAHIEAAPQESRQPEPRLETASADFFADAAPGE